MTATVRPKAEMDGRRLARRLSIGLSLRSITANMVGAVVVFTYLQVVSFGPVTTGASRLAATLAFAIYGPAAVAVGIVSGARRSAPVRAWLTEGRRPNDAERRRTLAQPVYQASSSLVLWGGAVVLFTSLSLTVFGNAVGRSIYIGGIILLGGLTSSALVFLLVEDGMRPVVARALTGSIPGDMRRLGVRSHLLLAWGLGSGIILLGLALIPLGPVGPHGIGGQVVFLALVGLVTGSALTVAVARLLTAPLAEVRAGLARVQEGDVQFSIVVDDVGEVGLLEAGFNAMVEGLRERQLLHDLFGRHVGPEVAKRALEKGVSMGGEVREVSVLFVDLVGSTTLAQTRPATEVVALLNDFFGAVVRVVAAEDGWVNKFEGDAALCVWGAPEDQADHATRALRAARQLTASLRELAQAHPGLDVGIAVSSGPVVAGNVGAEERYEYTVIGDPVNEAARLTELAKSAASRVVASGAALERAGDLEAKQWTSAGEVSLRGRLETTTVHEPVEFGGCATMGAIGG